MSADPVPLSADGRASCLPGRVPSRFGDWSPGGGHASSRPGHASPCRGRVSLDPRRGSGRCARVARRGGRRERHRCRAFSLLESLLVLALVFGLATFAWPLLTDAVQRARVEWTAHALVSAIGYARAEAVRRGAPTTVCRSDAQDRCSNQPLRCDGRVVPGNDWRCGWAVVAGRRADRGGMQRMPVLRRFSAPRGVAVIGTRGSQLLTFRAPSGLAPGGASRIDVLASVAAGDRAGLAKARRPPRSHRCLLVGISGRVRVSESGCEAGRA